MSVLPAAEQSDFDPVSAIRILRCDFEHRLQKLISEPFPPAKADKVQEEVSSEKESQSEQPLVVPQKVAAMQQPVRPSVRTKHRKAKRRERVAHLQKLTAVKERRGKSSRRLGFLDYFNYVLTLTGLTGFVFAVLCLIRGWQSDLSMGAPICVAGSTMIVVGLAGRYLAK